MGTHGLDLNVVRGRMAAAALIVGTLVGGCSSEEPSDPNTQDNAVEADDDNDDNDDNDDKPSGTVDAGKKKDAAANTTPRDAGTGAADAAKGSDAGGGKTSTGSGLPCDIEKILSEHCGTCHGAKPAGAPMSLTKLADFQAAWTSDKSKKIYELAKTRINAKTKPMPPVDPLPAADLATLNAWLDKSAPAGTESCAPVAGPDTDDPDDIDVTGLECYKMLAHAQGDKNAKFKVGTAVDRYINFGFQAPWQGMVYGIIVRPVIDNAASLHHWLLYKEDVADGSIVDTIGQHAGGELIHGWAPGGIAMDFRKHGDVGFELPASTYSIEIHYNSSDPSAEDASGVEVCVQKTPPKDIASMSWLGYDQGGVLSYASGICFEPDTTWTGTCRPQSQEPIHMIFITPHLHQAGRHLRSVINGPSGSRTLHDKAFDFNYQITYQTEEVLMPGESVTTTCTFSEPKCAGQATSQEMCYLFTWAYPKHALTDNAPAGALMHGKGVCTGQ